MQYSSNPQLDLAYDYVCQTNKNIFLTGKAGTGKTTFLNRIRQEPLKRMAVVAPTGVAAINAGGMTIHSFFQLPFGPFLPGATQDAARQRRFTREKIRLIQSLDLLVIDEISMVRADLLDGIDDVLRRYRDRFQPFGGLQLLMIGDLHQLPPVVKDDEWDMLRSHYDTPYFFSSQALRQTDPVTIELKHIYRQSDSTFIDLLNRVRDNLIDREVLDILNSRFQPNFKPTEEEPYITLTSHNAAAQQINQQKLGELPGKVHRFKAVITGEFPEHAYPAEVTLDLKIGAQVMFIKNDLAPEKRYYNGKIGQITAIGNESVSVRCPGDSNSITVGVADWNNLKFTLNETTREVSEEIQGTFSQYPLRLAWGITIHKSQGLTFERAIIDAQAAFAHGQVYVALSRCKSFEGVVLRTRLESSSIRTDGIVRNYTEAANRNAPDENRLLIAKAAYHQAQIRDLFSFKDLKRYFEQMNRVFMEHESSLLAEGFRAFKQLALDAEQHLFEVARKFAPQLERYFALASQPEENEALQERLKKGAAWFADQIDQNLIPAAKAVAIVTDNKAVRKTALDTFERLDKELFVKGACFRLVRESGFIAQELLRARTNAQLDFEAPQTVQPGSAARAFEAVRNSPHPELYARLKKWREDEAADKGVELYMVFSTRSLLEIAEQLPMRTQELKKVRGVGAAKVKAFGDALLTIVRHYCQEKGLAPVTLELMEAESEPEGPQKPPKVNTKVVSLELFKGGMAIDDIARERGFVRSTIENHLSHFIRLGELALYDCIDPDRAQAIENLYAENPERSKNELKEILGDAYSYGEIEMVRQYLLWKNEQG